MSPRPVPAATAVLLALTLMALPAVGPLAATANASVERWLRGTYAYRALPDGAERGSEQFQLTVHPDGSRTMIMWQNLNDRGTQLSVILRVSDGFRPLEAYVSYWIASGYKGSGTFTVAGDQLVVRSRGPGGQIDETLAVPAEFSIGTHPVAADGWHLWYADKASGELRLYALDASTDLARPLSGAFAVMSYERVGSERLSTPAGDFDTVHYRLGGANDLWVSGEDRLLVRMLAPRARSEYLLVRLEREPAGVDSRPPD